MIYLVTARIHVHKYMEDSVNFCVTKDIQLVEANSIGEAQQIYEKHWKDQCSEYSEMYSVYSLQVKEPLR